MEDKDLLKKYRETQDLQYISVLYKRYMHLVLGSCIKYFQNESDAEDAVMDIYEKIVKKTLTSDVTYFKSWLYTVTRNHCLEKLRRKSTHSGKESTAQLMYTREVFHPDNVNKDHEVNVLHTCIEELDEVQRQCVELFYFKKLSYKEIAERLGLNFNKVRSRIQNGRRNIKICMELKGRQPID